MTRWYMWPLFIKIGDIGLWLRGRQEDALFNDVEATLRRE